MSITGPNLALVLDALAMNRPREAVILAQDALRHQPHDPGLHAALGIALCCVQEVEAALAAIERAHYLAPSDPRILYNYGLILEKIGRPSEARERLYAAVKLDPGYERALLHLAQLPPAYPTNHRELPDPGPGIRDAELRLDTRLPGQELLEPTAGSGKAETAPYPSPAQPTAVTPWWQQSAARRLFLVGGMITSGALLFSAANHSAGGSVSSFVPPVANAVESRPGVVRNDMNSARLAGSSFPGVDFNGVDLRNADLTQANLRGATFCKADLRNTRLGQSIMIGTTLKEANLEGAYLVGANLWNADLRNANLRKAYLKAGKLGRAQLENAKLPEAVLSYTDLSAAALRNADFTGASLRGADLSRADLRGTCLNGADLRFARLGEADLTGATYNEKTRWPSDFDPINRGAIGPPIEP